MKKLRSLKEGSETTGKGSRSKPEKWVRPYELVDLDRWLAELIGDDPKARLAVEEQMATRDIIRVLINLREKAGLTQKQLAEKMGVTQQMVSKMENVNYEGRTFAKIWRHADALGYRPVIKFEPVEKWRKKHPIPGLDDKE